MISLKENNVVLCLRIISILNFANIFILVIDGIMGILDKFSFHDPSVSFGWTVILSISLLACLQLEKYHRYIMKAGYKAEASNDPYLFPLVIFIISFILSIYIIFKVPDNSGEGDIGLFFAILLYLPSFIIFLISLSIAGHGTSKIYKKIKMESRLK
jgi:hypothetical protein